MQTSGYKTICDRTGQLIKAHFSVESANGEASIVVESRGGSSGAPNERNAQYNLGVDLLLDRLAEIDCILQDAVLDTRATERMGLSRRVQQCQPASECSVFSASRCVPVNCADDEYVPSLAASECDRCGHAQRAAAVRVNPNPDPFQG